MMMPTVPRAHRMDPDTMPTVLITRALLDAFRAPEMSPAARREETSMDLMRPMTPKMKQQHIKLSIEHPQTKGFFGFGHQLGLLCRRRRWQRRWWWWVQRSGSVPPEGPDDDVDDDADGAQGPQDGPRHDAHRVDHPRAVGRVPRPRDVAGGAQGGDLDGLDEADDAEDEAAAYQVEHRAPPCSR
eukprot:TRINITY_DN1525_c0_g1_i10.p1 TRINITY_DN1525_c0_g1~~TRINITY_DN1525_c0_g1_i10.p1  ORF type:complete len:185 (+),score=26.52 TRINITY_DN1525_c0_g1_i10:146-700(+)